MKLTAVVGLTLFSTFTLIGCSGTGDTRDSGELAVPGLPADADLSRMPEQRELVQRGYYYDRNGKLKKLEQTLMPAPACIVEAHRGSAEAPENSQQSVVTALRQGYSGVEVDVQQTVDGHWVLHHDKVLGRTVVAGFYTGKRVGQINLKTWRKLRLRDRDGAATRVRAPILAEVLQAFRDEAKPEQYLNIEIKGDYSCPAVRKLQRQVTEHLAVSQIHFSSMDLATLRCLRKSNKQLYLGYVAPPEEASLEASSRGNYSKIRNGLLRHTGIDVRAMAGKHNETVPLDREGVHRLQSQLGKRAGVHLDVRRIEQQPELAQTVRDGGLSLYSYSINGADFHRQTLSRLAPGTRARLSGVISDSRKSEVCGIFLSGANRGF